MAKANSRSSNVTKSDKRVVKSAKKNYLSELCYQLEKAAAGLTHTSESDYPYRFFSLIPSGTPSDDGKVSVVAFLSSIGLSQELIHEFKIPIGEWIEERPFDNFLPSVQDIAGYYGLEINNKKVVTQSRRYRNLEKVILKRLRDVKVFRVGRVDIRCYIAGFTKQGNIAGLVTTSIET
jgi:hypothetical protein